MTTIVEHRYGPRGAAKVLRARRDPEIVVCGPAGTGKSRACLEKMHFLMLANPGARGLMVRKTATALKNSALEDWRNTVVKEALETGDVWWYGGSNQEPAQYKYKNGSAVHVGGMDEPGRIMSTQYDFIYVQEVTERGFTEHDWMLLTTRLRNAKASFRQIMADCNPSHPQHWVLQRANANPPRLAMLTSTHQDNPTLYRAIWPPNHADHGSCDCAVRYELTELGHDYMRQLDGLVGVERSQLLEGKWAAAEGVIYGEFNFAVHLVDRFHIPDEWTRWWAVDFGYTNPFVLQWWAEDPDGRLYLYREIYQSEKTINELARLALAQVTDDDGNWKEPRPRAIICDHDAGDRAILEKELASAKFGTNTIPAQKYKLVGRGIQLVKRRLTASHDGKPRLFIMRGSLVATDSKRKRDGKTLCTADEFPAYVWQKNNKEVPVKEDDHGMDAMRYLVAHRDFKPGAPKFRWVDV